MLELGLVLERADGSKDRVQSNEGLMDQLEERDEREEDQDAPDEVVDAPDVQVDLHDQTR